MDVGISFPFKGEEVLAHCKIFVILLVTTYILWLITTHDTWGGYFRDNKYIINGNRFNTATYMLRGLSELLGRHHVGDSSSRLSCSYASTEDTSHYG
jgi:hypothetical protein